MIRLIMVTGLSGSGKSSLVKDILSAKKDFRRAIQYTTRPKRYNTEDEYVFVNDTEYNKIFGSTPNITREGDTILSDRSYIITKHDNTNDVWRYGLKVSNQELNAPRLITYVMAASMSQILDVTSVLLSVPTVRRRLFVDVVFIQDDLEEQKPNFAIERLGRLYHRETMSDNPNYGELLRRFFEDSNLDELKIIYNMCTEINKVYDRMCPFIYNHDLNKFILSLNSAYKELKESNEAEKMSREEGD